MKQATVVVTDEVNCKITGLDIAIRKELLDKFKIFNPKNKYLSSVKLKRWDGKVPFFQMGGTTYINLLPDILKYIQLNGYDIELDDQRDYLQSFEFEPVTEDYFSYAVWPEGHEEAGNPIKLRNYQVDSINSFLTNQQSIGEISTGSGKTLITAALSKQCQQYGRTLVIVPNTSLILQTDRDYLNVGLDVGVLYGNRKEYTKTHTISTWQSLNVLYKASKDDPEALETLKTLLHDVVCVIVDEAHTVEGDVLKFILTNVLNKIQIRWGLTGTVSKDDFAYTTLVVSIGEVVQKLASASLQQQQVLASCHVNVIQMLDFKEFKLYKDEINYLLNTETRLQSIAQIIEKISNTGNTLVLIERVNAGKKLASMIPSASFISGSTKVKERKEEYESFTLNDSKVTIATFGIAAVGINIVRIHNLVLIEAGKSFTRVIQSIGRGLRKGFDKDHVEIYDLTSSCSFSKLHLRKRKQYYKNAQFPFTIEKYNWSA